MIELNDLHAISTTILSWLAPILLALATWAVKRIFGKLDELKHCIVESEHRNAKSLGEIKGTLADHGERIARLETRCLLTHGVRHEQ